MSEKINQQQKPRRAGCNGDHGAQRCVGKKTKYSLYGPTILWDEWQLDFPFKVTSEVLAGATNADEMATLCLAGDTVEQLQDDWRREMRIDTLKRASREFDCDSDSLQEREALQAIDDQLDVELYSYHRALVASGWERKWPILIRMFGFLACTAKIMVENGECIVQERCEIANVTPVN